MKVSMNNEFFQNLKIESEMIMLRMNLFLFKVKNQAMSCLLNARFAI